jgi:hypothetical protein
MGFFFLFFFQFSCPEVTELDGEKEEERLKVSYIVQVGRPVGWA